MTAPYVDLYFTFGVKYRDEPHPYLTAAHPDGWLRVRGHSLREALDIGGAITLGLYAFYYPADRFNPASYPRGELMFCDLTAGQDPMPEGLVERMLGPVVKWNGIPASKRAAGRLLDGRTWDEYPDGAS